MENRKLQKRNVATDEKSFHLLDFDAFRHLFFTKRHCPERRYRFKRHPQIAGDLGISTMALRKTCSKRKTTIGPEG